MPTRLTELDWQSVFVDRFPGDPERRNFVRRVSNVLYSETVPTPVRAPKLIGWADRFAAELGIERPMEEGNADVDLLAGNRVLPGMRPYAARYGGHQFGQWAGQLGDGRAITLGEAVFPNHGRLEFQLKGPGRTPYSRHADGRAVLRSSLREFLCSEAMHFLGIPTTRALSLVATGEPVVRDMFYDGHPAPEPGAIVCRVAPSFVRFGNFEILTAAGEHDLLKQLADFVIADYFTDLDPRDPNVYGQWLDEIARRTAVMVAHWQRVGFVHGVMNTDNMSILGLTIDYGPYGWLEPFDPGWTPNTTDAGMRRYRFGGQPAVAMWNLGRLGAALMPLIDDEERVYRSLNAYQQAFADEYGRVLAGKLGVSDVDSDEGQELVESMQELLQAAETDYTIFFRGLSNWASKGEPGRLLEHVSPAFYAELPDELRGRWLAWGERYVHRLSREAATDAERTAAMKRVNPKYVPRNYLAQLAIDAAEKGDTSVLERLMCVLERPYDEQPGEEDLAARRPEWARSRAGCSALSCSS